MSGSSRANFGGKLEILSFTFLDGIFIFSANALLIICQIAFPYLQRSFFYVGRCFLAEQWYFRFSLAMVGNTDDWWRWQWEALPLHRECHRLSESNSAAACVISENRLKTQLHITASSKSKKYHRKMPSGQVKLYILSFSRISLAGSRSREQITHYYLYMVEICSDFSFHLMYHMTQCDLCIYDLHGGKKVMCDPAQTMLY